MILEKALKTATIIAFPTTARCPTLGDLGPAETLVRVPISAALLAEKFSEHFLPIVQASVDLLEADNVDFEARCRGMLDTDGIAMIDGLCAEFDTVGRQMRLLVDGLELTRARLRTACLSWEPRGRELADEFRP